MSCASRRRTLERCDCDMSGRRPSSFPYIFGICSRRFRARGPVRHDTLGLLVAYATTYEATTFKTAQTPDRSAQDCVARLRTRTDPAGHRGDGIHRCRRAGAQGRADDAQVQVQEVPDLVALALWASAALRRRTHGARACRRAPHVAVWRCARGGRVFSLEETRVRLIRDRVSRAAACFRVVVDAAQQRRGMRFVREGTFANLPHAFSRIDARR